MKKIYLAKCREEVLAFCESIHQIYSKDIDLSKKKVEFGELKKPMTFAEVKQF